MPPPPLKIRSAVELYQNLFQPDLIKNYLDEFRGYFELLFINILLPKINPVMFHPAIFELIILIAFVPKNISVQFALTFHLG
jgi:hypothetical protein